MDPILPSNSALYLTLILLSISRGISGATFTLINRCSYTVWPGILANAGSPALESTGFELPPTGSRSFAAQPGWSGRFWGRTGCTNDPSTGEFTCLTGDCSSNQVECNGNNANPPATLAEFTIGSGATLDYYDVSLVDGYNLPLMVEPNGGSGSCQPTGCSADLNKQCPADLRAESGDACKSACEAFGSPEYCCREAYASPDTCKPSVYSEMFKAACPRAYSYAFDDPTSTFTCGGADYVITFCPSVASQKSASLTSTANGSGQGSTSSGDPLGSWLPSFFSGDSSSKLSCSAWHSMFIASAVFILLFLHP